MRIPFTTTTFIGPLLRRAVQPRPAPFPAAAFLSSSSSSLFVAARGARACAPLSQPRQLRGSLLSLLPLPRAVAVAAASARGISTKRRRVRKMNKHRFQKRKKRMRNLNAKNLRTK